MHRFGVISFHLLEDRIIKQFFERIAGRAVNRTDSEASQLREKIAETVPARPIVSGRSEISSNARNRLVNMRVLENIK
jgi:16S rRNA C1402 N4-methylase RsmH